MRLSLRARPDARRTGTNRADGQRTDRLRAEIVPVDEARKRYDLSRLPEGATEVRIVHIGSFDSCPCIGKHVSNTSEIPSVAIVSSDWADGVLRIRFKLAK